MALRNLGIEHEVVAIAEIDKYAIKSYAAIHNDLLNNIIEKTDEEMYEFLESRNVPLNYKTFKCEARKLKGDELKQVYTACVLSNNLGDISKMDHYDIPDHDLFTYSFPCQDISVAGKQNGLDKGSQTRSGLLWECEKVISAKKPKYLLLENVKNLVGKKHKHNFDEWLEWLECQGYTNYWKVLNAKDYGIPQNRERVFVVSILNDGEFEFENEKELDKCLADLLENSVDKDFYLSEKVQERFKQTKPDDGTNNVIGTTAPDFRTIGQRDQVYSKKGIMGSLVATDYKQPKQIFDFEPPVELTVRLKDVLETNVDEKFYLDDEKVKQLVYRDVKKETSVKQIGNIVHTGNFENPLRIRKLTPLECWRLMGFSDEDFYKAEQVCSNTQLYKQAGNSIVVNVLESIFRQLFKEEM